MDPQDFVIWIIRILKWLIPALIRVAIFTFQCLALSFLTWWRGVPATVRRIAQQWLEIINPDSEHDEFFYKAACVVAFLTVVVAWVISAFVTVWLVRWIWFRIV